MLRRVGVESIGWWRVGVGGRGDSRGDSHVKKSKTRPKTRTEGTGLKGESRLDVSKSKSQKM